MRAARSEPTLLDIADRLLDTGVSITGEATISVADVDLIYLGLDLALASVETVRGRGAPPLSPGPRASEGSARNVPGERGTEPEVSDGGHGPGAMSAELYAPEAERVRAELPSRVDVDPDHVDRGLAKLVLTIVELVRQLLERQAIRRMEAGSLSEAEVERVGVALMRLQVKVGEMAARFGLRREDLTLRLGPLGELL